MCVWGQFVLKFDYVFADKPGMLDLKGKAKWQAWLDKKGLSKDAAKEAYIAKIAELSTKYT